MKKRKPKSKKPHDPAVAGMTRAQSEGEFRVMTVALIRAPAQADAAEVAFSESARFYRLLRANPRFEKILAVLREAMEKRRPLRVRMENPQGNTIRDASAAEDRSERMDG